MSDVRLVFRLDREFGGDEFEAAHSIASELDDHFIVRTYDGGNEEQYIATEIDDDE